MKIKNLKKSLAVLTAVVLLAAGIPMSAFNVFAASTYDITYKDRVTTAGGKASTVADEFKVMNISAGYAATLYEPGVTEEANGNLSIPHSTRNDCNEKNSTSGDLYMFTLKNAPAGGDLLSYEFTIPTGKFFGRPNGLLIPLYYDQGTERYVSIFTCTNGKSTSWSLGRAYTTLNYFGKFNNTDADIAISKTEVYDKIKSTKVKVIYTYDGDTITNVNVAETLFNDSGVQLATISKDYTAKEILATININSGTSLINGSKPSPWEETDVSVTSLDKSGALAGFISGPNDLSHVSSVIKNAISSFTASYDITSTLPFEQKYADVLDGSSNDANRTLEMYAEYKAGVEVSDETAAKIETAVTNAGLRPTAGNATLSVNADTHIAFYAYKPTANSVTSTVGALVSAYNYMVENGISELKKGMDNAGVLEVTPKVITNVGNGDLMLKVTNLYGAEKNWGNWIVVRYYATYTVNDTPVVIYSTKANDNNPQAATRVNSEGVTIRSINGLIKSIANTMASKVGEKGNTEGVSYNDKNGDPQNTYTGKKLSEAYAENGESTIYDTALNTLYFLMAYKGVL